MQPVLLISGSNEPVDSKEMAGCVKESREDFDRPVFLDLERVLNNYGSCLSGIEGP